MNAQHGKPKWHQGKDYTGNKGFRFGIAENVTPCRIYELHPTLATGIYFRLVKNAQMQGVR